MKGGPGPIETLPPYPEPERRKLARNVLRGALRLKRGENLIVETFSATLPWAESLVLEARLIGARPLLWVENEATYWQSLEEVPDANLGQIGSHEFAALKEAHAYVYLWGPMDTVREEGRSARLTRRIEAVDHEFFRLAQKYHVRTVRWDLGRTNTQRAKAYGVDIDQWRRELIDATTFDSRILRQDGLRVADALRRGKSVSITHPNGTDLKIRLLHRKPIVDDGVIDEADVRAGNVWTVVPSGVTMVTVDESYAEGTWVSNRPGVMFVSHRERALPAGTWTFQKGTLAEYAFGPGGDEFRRSFPKMGPGAGRPGLLSIGLNPKISSIPLLFDQERGRVTLAIGQNSYHGGATRTPPFTAYQSISGATVTVEGETVVEDGKLV